MDELFQSVNSPNCPACRDISPVPGGWRVVFNDEILDLCHTREEARTRIREYKRDPGLAHVATVIMA